MARFPDIALLVCCFVLVSLPLSGRLCSQASEDAHSTRIICSNDTQGYLEPCGCGGRNTGGLARRATLIQTLRTGHPNSVVVDSGNVMERLTPRETCNSKLMEAMSKSFGIMGYDGVGVGVLDLPYHGVYYKALRDRGVAALQVSLDQPEGVDPYRIKVVGSVKVGILSFGAVPDVSASDIDLFRARYAAFSAARRECDILVLLDQSGTATNEWIERVSKRFGRPDIVVGGADRLPKAEPEMVGQTMVVPTCSQGVFVGCVDVRIDGQGQKNMTYSRYAVHPKVEKDPQVQALVDKYYWGGLAAKPEAPAKKPYFPYTGCADCHQREYAQWRKTPHASALVTLTKKDRAVPSCLKCHSERYRTLDSLAIGQDDLQAVECASCHSDVLPHDSKPTKPKTDMKTKCLACHNQERSPNFDYNKYIKLVSHKRR